MTRAEIDAELAALLATVCMVCLVDEHGVCASCRARYVKLITARGMPDTWEEFDELMDGDSRRMRKIVAEAFGT